MKKRKRTLPPGVKPLHDGRYKVDVSITRTDRRIRTGLSFEEAKELAQEFLRQKLALKRMQNGLETVNPVRYKIVNAICEFQREYSDRSPATILRYNQIIVQFDHFIRRSMIQYLDQFTPQFASAFKDALLNEKSDPKGATDRILSPSPKTTNMYLGLVRAFFKRQVELDRLSRSPFDSIRNVKLRKKLPEFYSEEELRRLFSMKMSSYYRRFFIGLLYTGFRFNELASLRWKDIDFERNLVGVCERPGFTAKTKNAYRSIPLARTLRRELEPMKDTMAPDNLVFTTESGRKIPERTALAKCKCYGKIAGLSCSVNLHKFRHTYASHLVQRGIRIEEIRVLLGHSTIKETMVYAHLKPEELHHRTEVLETLDIGL